MYRKLISSLPFVESKKYNYPREYYYQKLFDKHKDLSMYLKLVNFDNQSEALNTKNDISFFKGVDFEDTTIRKVKKKLKSPNYSIVKKYDLCKVEILFYRIKIGTHKVKLEMHFLDKKLFHYSYTFSYLEDIEKKELVDVVRQKYNVARPINIETDFLLNDKKSVISFTDNFDFTINYTSCADVVFFNKIKASVDKMKQKEVYLLERKQKELFEKI